jgi:hypothetical protein
MMKKVIWFISIIILAINISAEELQFQVIQQTPYVIVSGRRIIQYLENDEIITCENIVAYNQVFAEFADRDHSLNIVVMQDHTEYWTQVEDLLPLDTHDIFSQEIVINHDRNNNELWLPSYYANVLSSKTREQFVFFESSWLPFQIELPDGSVFYWYESYNIQERGEIIFYNAAIQISGPNSLIVKDIAKTAYGYKVTCIKSYLNVNDTGSKFDWSLTEEQIYFDLLMYLDGDYIDLYVNDTSRKFGSIIRAEKEFATQFEALIKTNDCDLTNVTWPRRADGSMDYPPPQLVQAAPEQPETVTIDTPPAEEGDVAAVTPAGETVAYQPGIGLPLVIVLAVAGVAIAAGVVVFLIRRKR